MRLDVLDIKGDYFPWRKAVDVVALVNITFPLVGKVISGKTVTSVMRVLLTAQTNPVDNGVYVNNARTDDFNDNESGVSTIFYDLNTYTFTLCTGGTVGSSPVNFVQTVQPQVSNPLVGQSLVYNGTGWTNDWPSGSSTRYYGELSQFSNSSITMSRQNTWYPINPQSTSLIGNLRDSRDGKLVWVEEESCVKVEYYMTLSNSASNQNLEFSIYVDGEYSIPNILRQRLIASTDIQVVSFSKFMCLDEKKELQIFVRNVSSNSTILTIQTFIFSAIGF
jgi:hypothetical protein